MAFRIPATNPTLATLMLGVATVVAQAILLREAMAAMGGSETAWGLVMALWLAGMGAGARLAGRSGSASFARGLPVAVLVLCAAGILLFRAAPALLGATPGETLTTLRAAWLWALAVAPAAAAGGAAFPLLAGELGSGGPGRAYALEAIGALAGGLVLTAVLLPLGTAAALLATTGVVAGVLLLPRHPVAAAVAATACLGLALPAHGVLARATWEWSGRPGSLGGWAETRHQRLAVSEGAPTALYANGRLRATVPDPYGTELRAHLVMLLHPEPRRVLAVGSAADGSLAAMVRHPVDEILAVEEDPELIDWLRHWYGPDFRDLLDRPGVRTLTTDPLRAIAEHRDLDLVVLAGGDPTTLRANRIRTLEFFRSCRSAMTPGGILVLEVGVSDTYLGGVAGHLVDVLAATLKEAFPRITAIPGERILLVAGAERAELTTAPAALEARLAVRPGLAETLHPALVRMLVDPERQQPLEARVLAAEAPLNTAAHPHAVLVAASLHEARSSRSLVRLGAVLESHSPTPLLWGLAAAAAVLAAVTASPRHPVRAVTVAAVIGFSSMGWWLLLLATWQATRGSVYAEVGALTGLFMAGVAGGGWLGLRRRHGHWVLPGLLGAGVVLSLLVASGAPARLPIPVVPSLLLLGGGITGAAFPRLGELAGEGSGRRGAGLAFAADELGAAAAALLVGTVILPWAGLPASALGLAVLGLAALPAALRR
ncbi:MAG TPA: hypothetical protein VLT32_04385 [Candidatus Sulfomarinibacteraceae bacterium]|nr:hypothetical protein [Candidatus Sulfomarinibacteraceae bacterium]